MQKQLKRKKNPDSPIDLSVIIVNYNTKDYLKGCLKSVSEQSGIRFETFVVDNASQDCSRHMIEQEFPWVKLLANDQNLGFARANNQALKLCKGKYIYFLNPDTKVEPGCFKTMIAFMDKNPHVGLSGTKILFPDRSLHPSVGHEYPSESHARAALKGLPGNIAWVLGASMISPRQVIESLDGFDATFFLYGEEQDLCLRIRKSGKDIGYIEGAVVVHWGGKSERGNLPAEIWSKKIKAEYLFYRKHYPEKALRSIKRANLLQAYWRIFTIKLTMPFSKNKEKHQNKLSKYHQVLKTFS